MVLFLFGLIQLLLLRFSSGDVYPLYSSLRSDPLGTKALYESLEVCCDFRVERNYDAFSKIQDRFDATIIVAGMSDSALRSVPAKIVQEVNSFVAGGGRLVITLHTARLDQEIMRSLEDSSEEVVDLTDAWGIRFFREKKVTVNAQLSDQYSNSGLPRTISSHLPIYFQTVDPGWKTVYERDNHPVIVERRLARGSLVISAESYFLSNEALVKERHPALLTWLIGNPSNVIFDEYHHGIAKSTGVMYLARKYDLEWFFILLMFLAILFIWRSAVPFVSPLREPQGALESGKESVAGLTNLLRRNIPAKELLAVCLSEWKKSARNISEEKQKAMEQAISRETAKPGRQQNLPATYNAVSRVLKERR